MNTEFLPDLDPELAQRLGISPEELKPATAEEKESVDQMRPSVSYWKDAFRRFRRNKLGMFMFFLLVAIILSAVIIPNVSPYTYKGQTADIRQGAFRLFQCRLIRRFG